MLRCALGRCFKSRPKPTCIAIAGTRRLDHFAGGLVWSRCAQESRDPSSGASGAVIFSFGTVGVVRREEEEEKKKKWGMVVEVRLGWVGLG